MLKNKVFVLGFILISSFSFSQIETGISFSHHAGFYDAPFYLKVKVDNGELYYFDKNNIDKDRRPFPDSLLINKTRVISLLIMHSDSIKRLGSFSYFIGFKTNFKVVSISIDDDFLFDRYKGIYVKGSRAYFDTVANHYKNANWDNKWERENFVEVFNETGGRIIAQSSGLKIFGGMTKHYPEKSLRLIARNRYGNSRFDVNLFNQGKKKYKQFVLRHSGNDYRRLRFRDALVTSLAVESGLDVQASSPSHLFVNSEYWGVYNIREKINKYYINNNYNFGTEGIDILQGFKRIDEGTLDEYNKLLTFVKRNNLQLDANYIEIQKTMDTRNFINFWIHQIFYANYDVRGNIRWWRADSLDGKFRWIVYDTDLGFENSKVSKNLLDKFTSSKMTTWYNPLWATFLLRNLLKNNDFKKDFIHQSSFILSSTLSTEHILKRINKFEDLYDEEMEIHFQQRKKFQKYQGRYKKWEEAIIKIKEFAERRDDFSFLHLEEKFDLDKPYYLDIKIENHQNGQVTINNNELDSEVFFGAFYNAFRLPININPNIGYSFSYTNIPFSGSPLSISGNSGDTVKVNIQFIENKPSEINILINEINFSNDYFEIYNLEEFPIDLSGWVITDQKNSYKIDSLILNAGSFAVFHYNKVLNIIDSVKYRNIGFSISDTKDISLYDDQNQAVDRFSSKLIESRRSYSRNMPFEELDEINFDWVKEESTIGFRNEAYTSLLADRDLRDKKAKRRRILTIATVGCALLIPVLIFLNRRQN